MLEGKSEADSVLCRTPRFLIFPDMKWDPSGPISSLYLLAIVFDTSIRSLRDLRGGPDGHVGMLEEIQDRAHSIAKERWGLPRGALRMYIHYQPSYCTWISLPPQVWTASWLIDAWVLDHFHVHIVHASQDGMMGMAVGQAHLLEDIISLVRLFLFGGMWLSCFLLSRNSSLRCWLNSSNTLRICCPSSR